MSVFVCKSVFGNFIHNSKKKWKQLRCSSMGEWLNKLWYVHIMQYYNKKDQTTEYTIWMNLQGIMMKKANLNSIYMTFLKW